MNDTITSTLTDVCDMPLAVLPACGLPLDRIVPDLPAAAPAMPLTFNSSI